MFPYNEEHVEDVMRAGRHFDQVGLVIVLGCMAHNGDHCVKWFLIGKKVVVRLPVWGHIDSLLLEDIQWCTFVVRANTNIADVGNIVDFVLPGVEIQQIEDCSKAPCRV